jgi:hypothetical protein
MGIPLLAEVPLESRFRELADAGRIVEVLDLPASGPPLLEMATRLTESIAEHRRQHLPIVGS